MKKTMYMLLTMMLAFTVIFTSCNPNTEIPEEEIPVDPNAVKIDFEGITTTPWYSPGTAMTTVDSSSAASLSTDFKVSGTKSLKITGTLQDDKYSGDGFTMEMGIRIKTAEILDVAAVALVGQIFSINVYVPAAAVNTSVQVNLQDGGYQQAMGGAQTITAGQWNTLYYKLLSKDDTANTKYAGTKPTLAVCSSDGTVKAQGAYTGDTFDINDITEIEVRSLGPSEAAVAGTEVTLYVDDIDWRRI